MGYQQLQTSSSCFSSGGGDCDVVVVKQHSRQQELETVAPDDTASSASEATTKRVHFNPIYIVRYLGTPDEDENAEKWYCSRELQSFEIERRTTRRLALVVGPEQVEGYGKSTCRGLETLIDKDRSRLRITNHRRAVRAVLKEQKNQMSHQRRCRRQSLRRQSASRHLVVYDDEDDDEGCWFSSSFKRRRRRHPNNCRRHLLQKQSASRHLIVVDETDCGDDGAEQKTGCPMSSSSLSLSSVSSSSSTCTSSSTSTSPSSSQPTPDEAIAQKYKAISNRCHLLAHQLACTYWQEFLDAGAAATGSKTATTETSQGNDGSGKSVLSSTATEQSSRTALDASVDDDTTRTRTTPRTPPTPATSSKVPTGESNANAATAQTATIARRPSNRTLLSMKPTQGRSNGLGARISRSFRLVKKNSERSKMMISSPSLSSLVDKGAKDKKNRVAEADKARRQKKMAAPRRNTRNVFQWSRY